MTSTPVKPYPLDNDNSVSRRHHDNLSATLDPHTIERIEGLRDFTGATCLEVGAGGGSIAVWLAERVGPTGRVVATDLKPQHIPPHPQLTVVQHDLNGPVDLPEGPYDLIHARLVLNHLPERRRILSRLVAALAPGGYLLTEDWNARTAVDIVAAAPDDEAADLVRLYQETVGIKVFKAHGTDPTWARQVYSVMVEEGLVEVATTIRAEYWPGGSSGARLIAGTLDELRDKLLAAGLVQEQLDQLRPLLLSDPRMVLHGHPLYSTSGRRPLT